MIRRIAAFYLLGMFFSLAITLVVGARGADHMTVFSLALLSWPMAGLTLLAKSRIERIREAMSPALADS